MITSARLVFYMTTNLLFCPQNPWLLLLVGHLLWKVKRFDSSFKLICKGLYNFGLCKCYFPKTASFLIAFPIAGGLSLHEMGRVGVCWESSLLIQGYWYLLGIWSFQFLVMHSQKKLSIFLAHLAYLLLSSPLLLNSCGLMSGMALIPSLDVNLQSDSTVSELMLCSS